VLAVDFDPQNSLALKLGIVPAPAEGLASRGLLGGDWQATARTNSDRIQLLPFGRLDREGLRRFETLLAEQPRWLAQRLGALDLPPDAAVLIDTPRLPSVYADQAIAAAKVQLAILRADAASYAALRMFGAPGSTPLLYVLNKVEATHRLQNDVRALLRQDLGERLAPYPVHRDESVPEAEAANRSLIDYAVHSQAAYDLQGLGNWLHAALARLG
jgi:cellulose synthase operon protein YhjQ